MGIFMKEDCNQCNGIMELIGKSTSISVSSIEKVHRFEEDDLYQADTELFLIYKCSCCQRLEIRANSMLEDRLNGKNYLNTKKVVNQ
ncbi:MULTISPECIES: hypothetical protein [unclassified Paenibacillus]|uniref:hypothetical protein n=1 Tax=unclassified Paenibacillus TaxID=185978 RepID=UPI0006D24A19|nr:MULTISPECIES: hypothetical protein [unclassified Paenibacillus]